MLASYHPCLQLLPSSAMHSAILPLSISWRGTFRRADFGILRFHMSALSKPPSRQINFPPLHRTMCSGLTCSETRFYEGFVVVGGRGRGGQGKGGRGGRGGVDVQGSSNAPAFRPRSVAPRNAQGPKSNDDFRAMLNK